MTEPYSIILFDIGGVLVEFKGSKGLLDLSREPLTREQIKDYRKKTAVWIRSMESGKCSVEEFAEGFLREWPMKVGAEEFLAELRTWPLRLFPGVAETLQQLSKNFTVACLSNTNPLHWPRERDAMGLGRLFSRQYISYEIGYLKPDSKAFQHAIDDLNCPPGQILFLDDREENIEAARNLGMGARRTVGIDEVRAVLLELGLLG